MIDLPPVAVHQGVTAEQFFRDLVPASKPAVIKGLVADWHAVKLAAASPDPLVDYLKTLDNGTPAETMEAPASVKGLLFYTDDLHRFNFTKRKRGLSDTLDRLTALRRSGDGAALYMGSVPIRQHLPDFLRDHPTPFPLPVVAPRLWVGGPARVQTHFDPVYNLACVVAGRRRFVLFPPEQLANLYLGPFEHTPAGAAISLASLEEPDFERFPRFHQAIEAAVTAELEPGDALFLPHYWFHHVTALDPFNLLVNYWWGENKQGLDNPRNSFLTALLAIKDLEGDERVFWKTMFEHYVFQENGDPVAAIPADLQSAFGKMTPEMRARVKAFALGLLNEGR